MTASDDARVAAARAVIHDAVGGRAFPAAAAEVDASAGPIWAEAFGRLSFDEDAPTATLDTVFDLASLTKPIATTTIAMDLVGRGRLALDARVADLVAEWRGADREGVTIADLLEHASGLPARLVDQPPDSRREFEHEICATALEYAPRTRSIYSDIGFILLGFILENAGGAPLDEQFEAICERLGIDDLCFRRLPVTAGLKGPRHNSQVEGPRHSRPVKGPRDNSQMKGPRDNNQMKGPHHSRQVEGPRHNSQLKSRRDNSNCGAPLSGARSIAPTLPLPEDRRKRRLAGEVHDNYAFALGGVAGHAGLFGTAPAVGRFARLILRAARGDSTVPAPLTPDIVRRFTRRTTVPGSSRALGWDTMLPTSSCGSHMSREAFGHVGFTGTSLWIDPARDRAFTLLTNRAGGGRMDDRMREARAFHDTWA